MLELNPHSAFFIVLLMPHKLIFTINNRYQPTAPWMLLLPEEADLALAKLVWTNMSKLNMCLSRNGNK